MILTTDNYFGVEASTEYCGSSQYKDFLSCEAMAMAKIRGEYQQPVSNDMLFGKAVHAWSAGDIVKFRLENPELYKKDGTVQAKYQGIQAAINTIESDESMLSVLQGQKEVILTAEFFGLKWKVMIDVLNPDLGFFTDLKVMRSFQSVWSPKDKKYLSFISFWGYDLQLAIYAEVERIHSKRDDWLFPHLAVVTKQDPPDKAVFIGFYEQIPVILSRIEQQIPRIKALKSGEVQPIPCDDCAYCRSVKTAKFVDFSTFDIVPAVPVEGE